MIAIYESQFQKYVMENKKLTIVEFYAPWCPYCRNMSAILDRLSNRYADVADVYGVNIEENQRLSKKYMIQSLPTIIFYKGGRIVEQVLGQISENEMVSKITKHGMPINLGGLGLHFS